MTDILFHLPTGSSSAAISEPGFDGQWITIPKTALKGPGGAGFKLARSKRWMALERYITWWPRPMFGSTDSIPEAEFFMVLWEREDGGYGVVLPLVDQQVRGVLRGSSEGWSVRAPKYDPVPEQSTLLLAATGKDPIELVRTAMAKISKRLGTFKMRTEKDLPKWVHYFGWCTWDAFYLELSEEKVLEGLASFQKGGISPRVVILDGGWQDERGSEQLWSFGGHPDRFPQGIGSVIAKAKADYGVECFGVWHTLQGFWNGVNPASELAKNYRLISTEGIAYNMGPEAVSQKRSLVHPDDARRFFDDYHGVLRDLGADMVKVDNQASLDHFSTPEMPPTETMHAYQYALQDSVQKHFGGESLHCMSNTTDAAYALKSANVWRSSQDFFPAKPETQGLHVFDNPFNCIWVQTFALPDWDMFQSVHPAAGFHAAARAISGGPIYVSDKPGQHDFALLSKLMISCGRILRSLQPALPAYDCLFEDGRTQARVTKIFNFNEVEGLSSRIGVLGLFNCHYHEAGAQGADGEYCANDVPGVISPSFALYHHLSGRVEIADASRRLAIHLQPLGYELVTVAAIEKGVALFGLIDKFNGSRALEKVRWVSDHEVELVLGDGGRVGWHSPKPVLSATHQGAPVEIVSEGNLSWVKLPEGSPVTLRLRFT